jgi:ABC-2 type transport system permease protein
MKAYLAILSSRLRTLLQYRAAAIAGAGTQLFFGLVRMMIFEAFYLSSSIPQPMTSDQTVTYIWLGQALFLLTMVGPDPDVASMIRSGNVAYELTKPIDLYGLWFMRALSGRIVPLLMRGIPIFIVAGLFFRMQPPASVMAGTMFVMSVFGAFLLAASLVALLTMSLLLTISGEGIARLAPAPIFFFSGVAIPLPFFPDWMQPLIALLPIRGLIDTPLRLYMEHLSGGAALAALAHQFVWIVVFVMLGRMILARLIHRLIVQGG